MIHGQLRAAQTWLGLILLSRSTRAVWYQITTGCGNTHAIEKRGFCNDCTPKNRIVVGIELRRASCRWRVTKPALSIASWVLISTMAYVFEGPPIMPDGRISQVRFEVLASRL